MSQSNSVASCSGRAFFHLPFTSQPLLCFRSQLKCPLLWEASAPWYSHGPYTSLSWNLAPHVVNAWWLGFSWFPPRWSPSRCSQLYTWCLHGGVWYTAGAQKVFLEWMSYQTAPCTVKERKFTKVCGCLMPPRKLESRQEVETKHQVSWLLAGAPSTLLLPPLP